MRASSLVGRHKGPAGQSFSDRFLVGGMHVRRMARIDRDGHPGIRDVTQNTTLKIPKRRPVRSIQCGQLHEQKRKVALPPLSSPVANEERKKLRVLANPGLSFRIRFALVSDRAADGEREKRLNSDSPHEAWFERVIRAEVVARDWIARSRF